MYPVLPYLELNASLKSGFREELLSYLTANVETLCTANAYRKDKGKRVRKAKLMNTPQLLDAFTLG
jgi:hypothetical protein